MGRIADVDRLDQHSLRRCGGSHKRRGMINGATADGERFLDLRGRVADPWQIVERAGGKRYAPPCHGAAGVVCQRLAKAYDGLFVIVGVGPG